MRPHAPGFDDAVRRYFAAPADAQVESSFDGGNEFQIGDYTWDTEPYNVTITVYIRAKGKPVEVREESFTDLPSLWDALLGGGGA